MPRKKSRKRPPGQKDDRTVDLEGIEEQRERRIAELAEYFKILREGTQALRWALPLFVLCPIGFWGMVYLLLRLLRWIAK